MTAPEGLSPAPVLLRHNQEAAHRILRSIEEGTYCAVLGPRFSGKTFLIRHIEHEIAQVFQWPSVYIDLYDMEASTLQGFFSRLVGRTAARIGELTGQVLPLPEADRVSSAVFRGFLADAVAHLRRDLLLIIDHLEAVPTDLVQALLTSLRAAYMEQQTQDYRLLVVASGALSLATLTVGESSPFRGIAERVFVGDLSESASAALIAEHAAAEGVSLSERAQGALLEVARGDPFLIRRIYQDAVQAVRVRALEPLPSQMVWDVTHRFLDREVFHYAPLQEAVRAIEDDPDLLTCVLWLLEREPLPRAELPLPLSPDVDPLYLTGVVEKVPGDRYRLRNEIYRRFLAHHFDPGRVGHLLTMAGRWDSAIDSLEASIVAGNEQYRTDLLPATIHSMYASEDVARAAHFLLRGLSAAFGIQTASVWYVPSHESHLRLVGQLGPASDGSAWIGQEIPVREDRLEARAFREALSLRGQEGSEDVVRAIPLLVPGRRPIGVISIHEPLAGDRFAAQRERDLQLIGYLNQAARALEQVSQRTREMALAGRMQASLLSASPSDVAGWQFAATLHPARETSGDFYDFIRLPEGRLGLLIADVTDKGLGAALFMALSRTLIRTFSARHAAEPASLLRATSEQILRDTEGGLFVTVFYGVLDPASGRLTYANAGHNPPYLLRAQEGMPPEALTGTGMALGVLEEATWTEATVEIGRGDALLLYTDGIPDAQSQPGTFFGMPRLLEVLESQRGRPAPEIQEALLAAVRAFVGEEPQFDDITLMAVSRDPKRPTPRVDLRRVV